MSFGLSLSFCHSVSFGLSLSFCAVLTMCRFCRITPLRSSDSHVHCKSSLFQSHDLSACMFNGRLTEWLEMVHLQAFEEEEEEGEMAEQLEGG